MRNWRAKKSKSAPPASTYMKNCQWDCGRFQHDMDHKVISSET